MKKLFLSLILVLALFLCCAAAQAEVSGDYTYDVLEDGTACITQYTGEAEELEIPAELDGIPVTVIGGDSFYNCQTLTAVVIPEGVKFIDVLAFAGCNTLSEVILPETLEEIGSFVFMGCPLKKVNIPAAVTSIGLDAFPTVYDPELVVYLVRGSYGERYAKVYEYHCEYID